MRSYTSLAPATEPRSIASRVAVQGWLTYWRAWQRYHRYTVTGLEHLARPTSVLIAGYHGRPLAFDMCMLTVAVYDRLGYLPHGVVHRGIDSVPPLKCFTDALGFITEDGTAIADVVARGEHIVTTPGGAQEGCRDFRHRYRVRWDNHLGYLRLALKYRLPIVPVGAAGADDTYIGLNDAEALGRRLGVPRRWAFALWTGIGPLGLYPFSPPFPVRLRQLVGAPIDLDSDGAVDPKDRGALLKLHERVTAAVQSLLDRARRGG